MAQIDDFKANLIGGGARANQFRITITPPPGIAIGLDVRRTSFLVTASQLPASNMAFIPVPFRGRNVFYPGDRRTFETWTTTVLNDTNFAVRNGIEQWMNGINDLETSVGQSDLLNYTADVIVQQLDRDDTVLKTYILTTCWPTVLAPIDLNMDTVSEIESFDITWRYTSFSIVGI